MLCICKHCLSCRFSFKKLWLLFCIYFLFKVKQRLIFIFQHGCLQNGWFTGWCLGYLVSLRCFFWKKRPAAGDTLQYISHFFELWSWDHQSHSLLNVFVCFFYLLYRRPGVSTDILFVESLHWRVHLNHKEEEGTQIISIYKIQSKNSWCLTNLTPGQ